MAYKDEVHHCGSKPGQPHKYICDVALCYWTGQQLIQCDGEGHDCSSAIWDGEYPGVKMCESIGLRYKDHPMFGNDADLNSLYSYGEWDVNLQQHTLTDEKLDKLRNL